MKEASNRNTAMKYRPDIDGLRCVAVLSVLAFHLSPARLPGGFVGVDIFFVISGYLISAIIFSEIAASRFSVLAFYERRVRRIFPALFGMLIAVSIVISFFLLPTEFIDYAKSVIAATTSSSNFYFWQHSGYFDSPTSNPLLHTWSLAVEEQFYILFPIFLVIMRRLFPQRLKLGVVALFLVSLGASEVTVHYNTTTAFYMPYTRAWELLLGTLISIGYFPRLRTKLSRNTASLLGIGMVVFSAARYSPQTLFPGLAALVPCFGSALIIGAGESGSSLVGKVLSWRPVVFVGLISYSLYLWHWPVIVLNGLGFLPNFSNVVPHKWALLLLSQVSNKAMELLLSFVLAILSWRFVERPFRSYPRRIERRPLFAFSAATMVVLILSSGSVIYARGFQGRFPLRAVQVASFLTPPGASTLGQLGDCAITEGNRSTVFDNSHCLQTSPGKETYLLLGDSHAGALLDGLKTSLPGSDVLLAAVWGCRPSIHSDDSPLCKQMMDFIFEKYLPSHPSEGLLLEARWYSKSLDGVADIAAWAKARGVRVIVFGPVAEYDAPLPRLLAYSIAWNRPNLAQEHRLAYSPLMDAQMQNLAANRWHVSYVSLYQTTCDSNRCLEYADETSAVPLLTDTDHLSEAGSRLLVRRLFHFGELDCLKDKPPLS
ncbi:MAG: acyltransferase family protein [Terriglobales bacterium]|jgi:peptidoglycan/LPS O-acetylase OafA/YrhL